ncbi:MAG TPA: hypothetical protein VFS44_03185 [Gemmatimonadaceae bacterium]|nr:hypothetical protein [Gemmatimonadaceae bacterium]
MAKRVEEMIAVRATAARAMDVLLTVARFREWQAPDVTMTPRAGAPRLTVGDRFDLEAVVGVRFACLVEAVSGREVVFAFDGPWSGRERWSFVPDGAEIVVRRVYEVEPRGALEGMAWRTVGAALVAAHYKYELPRFRDVVEREPGPRAEIEPPAPVPPVRAERAPEARGGAAEGGAGPSDAPPFPVDDA